jgi:hypothetical protein
MGKARDTRKESKKISTKTQKEKRKLKHEKKKIKKYDFPAGSIGD